MKTLNDVKKENLEALIGEKVFYTGDMANSECMWKIESFEVNRWGWQVTLSEGENENKKTEILDLITVGIEYEGPSGTRFILNSVYEDWKKRDLARAQKEEIEAWQRIEAEKEKSSAKSNPRQIMTFSQDGMGGGSYPAWVDLQDDFLENCCDDLNGNGYDFPRN
jgi:hypothetical protein